MGADDEDRRLLDAWQAGQEDAGHDLLQRHYLTVLRFFRNKAGDAAEDLAQRTFMALVEKRDRLKEVSSFRAYVLGVARFQLLMHLRARYRGGATFDADAFSVVQLSGGAHRNAVRGAQRELVARALQSLAVEYQIALELFYFEELGVAEIAEVQEASVSAVKTRLHRGRGMLKERLAELCDESELLQSVTADLDKWLRGLPSALARAKESGST